MEKDKLFDIAAANARDFLDAEDFSFLNDQRSSRKSTFGAKDSSAHKRFTRKRSAEEEENKRRHKSAKEMAATSSMVAFSSSEESMSGTDLADNFVVEENAPSRSKFVSLNIPRQITGLPHVIQAADRHKVSSNALNDILASLIRDCGGDINDFVVSKATTLRKRRISRSNQFETIKQTFEMNVADEYCTVHWDEKLLKEGNDTSAKEHIAILASHGDDVKLLGTSTLEAGTGLNQASAIKQMLNDWGIDRSCLAMCFDTTSANTGRMAGACILLEALIGHPLLWTACRHHMYEVVLSGVAKEVFGTSTGPKVEFFDMLKKTWPRLDLERDTMSIKIDENVCKKDVWTAKVCFDKLLATDDRYLPRDDYEELIKLCLIYVEKKSVNNFTFRRPGAHHRARWMSSAIYTLKMLLLQSQLDIDGETLMKLKLYGDFVACYYAPNWFRCPLPAEAATIDMSFMKKMMTLSESHSPLQKLALVAFKKNGTSPLVLDGGASSTFIVLPEYWKRGKTTDRTKVI